MVEVTKADPIWFFPHKFWAATRNLPKEQAEGLEYLRNDDSFEAFHSDPRYVSLLRRVGLPQ